MKINLKGSSDETTKVKSEKTKKSSKLGKKGKIQTDVVTNLDDLLISDDQEEVKVKKKKVKLKDSLGKLIKKPELSDPLLAQDIDYEEQLVFKTAEEQEAEVHMYFDAGMSLNEIEAAEYKKAKKELLIAEAKKIEQDRQDFIDSFRKPNTIFGFLGYTAGICAYLYYISNQVVFSLLIAIVLGVMLTYWMVYKENQLSLYQHDLHELQNVASDIEFESQTGKNALQILDKIRKKYKGRVGADLDYTYTKLLSETVLDTTNFYDYDFKAFNLFLRNFNIWYKEGGNTKALFTKAIDNISFELVQRDRLFKMNKGKRTSEMMVVMIALITPVLIKIFGGESYYQFLGLPMSVAILNIIFIFMVINTVTTIQKRVLDLKIRG